MNLPANPKTGSTHLSAERAEHREWIGGRALTLLSHYWRDDDPVELTAAIGADWADVLEGIPREYIQQACIVYQRENGDRKPKPGTIYQLARRLMPAPTPVQPAPEPERAQPTDAERARMQERINAAFPSLKKSGDAQ